MAYLAWILFLGALWGSSFTLIKIGVGGMPPFTLAATRVVIAALTLWTYLRAQGQRLPRSKEMLKHLIFVGIVNLGIPFAAISWGTQYLPSSIAGILNAAMPLLCFVLAALTGAEKATWAHLAGVVIGFGGILVLMLPGIGGEPIPWKGAAAILLASVCYATGVLYIRKHLTSHTPLVGVTGQTIFACLVLVPLSISESPWSAGITTQSLIITIILGLVHTALGNLLYYRVIYKYGATRGSYTCYVIPVFGILWGWLFLSESLTWNVFAALALIMLGLALVNDMIRMPKRTRLPDSPLAPDTPTGNRRKG